MRKPRFLLWKTRAMATATLAWEHFGGNTSSGETASPVLNVSGGRNLIDSLDHSLVSRCLDGDEAAWEDLVRQHTRQVYGLCFRFTNSTQEAQDLTQDVFLRVFKTIKTFRSTEGSFHTWLARVTRNLLIDHYRRTRQERVTDSIEEQLPMLEEAGGAAPPRPDQALAGREATLAQMRRIFIEPMANDLHEYIGAEIQRQLGGRVQVASSKEQADTIMRGNGELRSANAVTGKVLGVRRDQTASVTITDITGTSVLWTDEAGSRTILMGVIKKGGPRKLAENLVGGPDRSEEHTSELQSLRHLV